MPAAARARPPPHSDGGHCCHQPNYRSQQAPRPGRPRFAHARGTDAPLPSPAVPPLPRCLRTLLSAHWLVSTGNSSVPVPPGSCSFLAPHGRRTPLGRAGCAYYQSRRAARRGPARKEPSALAGAAGAGGRPWLGRWRCWVSAGGGPGARCAPRAAEGTVLGRRAAVGPAEPWGAPAPPVAASAWEGPGASRHPASGGRRWPRSRGLAGAVAIFRPALSPRTGFSGWQGFPWLVRCVPLLAKPKRAVARCCGMPWGSHGRKQTCSCSPKLPVLASLSEAQL